MFARSPNRRALFRAAFSASVGGLAWQALGHTQAMASTPPTGLPRLPAPPEDAGTWIDPRMAHPLPGTMSIEPLAGRIATENANKGNTGWDLTIKRAGLYTGDDVTQQIKGYAAADSVEVGADITFHVATNVDQTYRMDFFRLGYYGGMGGRLLRSVTGLRSTTRPTWTKDAGTLRVHCGWKPSYTLRIPSTWQSGVYFALLTDQRGYRNLVPFVVTDATKETDILVVLPFTTYQAYNSYPYRPSGGSSYYLTWGPNKEKRTGLSYFAREVSFDRPYLASGLPNWHFPKDHAFVQWVEAHGYDVRYASSLDLHQGRVDPSKYRAVVFPGHEEYWSAKMYDFVERARDGGTHVAFLGANNVYWHVRFESGPRGGQDRSMACYKGFWPDPRPDANGVTRLWRDLNRPEHRLLGNHFGWMLAGAPLVVSSADHWLWAGTGVKNGTKIPNMVAVEVDQHDPRYGVPQGTGFTLLSNSPLTSSDGKSGRQHSAIHTAPSGAIVFSAGTFVWGAGTMHPDYVDSRIQRATKNLLDRMTAR